MDSLRIQDAFQPYYDPRDCLNAVAKHRAVLASGIRIAPPVEGQNSPEKTDAAATREQPRRDA